MVAIDRKWMLCYLATEGGKCYYPEKIGKPRLTTV
jgi:hypothetical protein